MSSSETDGQGNNSFDTAYSDPTADICLVSEDGVKFRIHSYVLKTHSSVFKDMLSTSHLGATKTASSTPHEALAADEIPIDVPSDVLHAFIDLLCNGSTASNVVSSAWSHVVDLTLKYDCHIVQRLLGVQLYLMIDIDPWAVFCLATRLNDRRLVTAATAQLHRVPFLTAQPFAFRPPKESYYQSALRDVPLAKWEQISPKWAFQLMKAIIFVEDHKLPSRVDWAEVARKL